MRLILPSAMTKRLSTALKVCMADPLHPFPLEESLQAVAGQAEAIEPGIEIIDRGVPVPGLGSIDLLARDSALRPVVICVGELIDTALICKGFALADWVFGNMEMVRRACGGKKMQGEPRVWIFAGKKSREALSLIRRLGDSLPDIFVCRVLSVAGERRLLLERQIWEKNLIEGMPAGLTEVNADVGTEAKELKPVGRVRQGLFRLPMQSVLTEQEIDGIMRGKVDTRGFEDDEVTSSASL